jgi:hypothetical protein
VFGEKNY